MSLHSDLKAYYAQRAAEYERLYAKPERQPELAALRSWLAAELAGRTVMEIACGTGYWTAVIAPTAQAVWAGDCNEEVLALARTKSLPRATFLIADAYTPTPPPGGCDAALAAFWWSHVPLERVAGFLAGLHAVLPAGARVVFLDNVYAEGSSTPVSRRDAAGNTYQLRRLANGSQHEVLKNFPTADELRATLSAAGARELQVEFGQYYWRASYRR